MCTTLRQLYQKRLVRASIVSLFSLLVVSQYQNCTPMGDTSGTGDSTSLGMVNCAAVGAPIVGVSPGNKTASSGLGPMSGDVYPTNLKVSVGRSYPTQVLTENCNVSGVTGLDVNCNIQADNTMDIDVSANNGVECVSGTATVSLRVTDTECAKNSNTTTFQVAVTNVCPQQIKVKKDSSVSPDLVPARADMFGSRVAISGNTAVIVAASDDQGGSNTGAAFVYKWNGTNWVYQQKLMATGIAVNAELDSVAIDGSVIALGSPYNGTHGSVFIFRYNGSTWAQSEVLTPSLKNVSVTTQFYGSDVALSGGNLVVGSPGYNFGDSATYAQAGAVFVYQDSGSSFSESKVISASDKSIRQFFGAAVAISGVNIIVGAPLSPTAEKNSSPGKAYIYRTDNMTEVKLNAGTDAVNGSQFGYAVDVDGNRAVVGGITGPGSGGGTRGNVVTFDGAASWAKVGTQRIAGEQNGDLFGFSLALSGNNLLVGAPSNSTGDLVKSGAVYHYTYAGGATPWTRHYKFIPRKTDRSSEDYFGESVDIGSGFMLGGSRADDETDLNLGSAFFIKIP